MMTGSGAVRGFDFSSLAEDGGDFSTVVLASFTCTVFQVLSSFLHIHYHKLPVRQLHLLILDHGATSCTLGQADLNGCHKPPA
jgi:hypothetical protein